MSERQTTEQPTSPVKYEFKSVEEYADYIAQLPNDEARKSYLDMKKKYDEGKKGVVSTIESKNSKRTTLTDSVTIAFENLHKKLDTSDQADVLRKLQAVEKRWRIIAATADTGIEVVDIFHKIVPILNFVSRDTTRKQRYTDFKAIPVNELEKFLFDFVSKKQLPDKIAIRAYEQATGKKMSERTPVERAKAEIEIMASQSTKDNNLASTDQANVVFTGEAKAPVDVGKTDEARKTLEDIASVTTQK